MHKDGAAIWKRSTGRSHWREACRVAVKHGLRFLLGVVCVGFFPFFGQNNEIPVIMTLFGAGPKSHVGADEKLVFIDLINIQHGKVTSAHCFLKI
jgi:hypothetical protein